ncbi:MAG: hypothetical protein L3K52_00065 [Candidatus Thiothrix sulfatifontis]|nr:MAG: hypothetical protein L3K52_00065 [Candidatus Thiothrix sulfatifontis]
MQGAQAQLPALQQLAALTGATPRRAVAQQNNQDAPIRVAAVQLENESSLSDKLVRQKLGIQPGEVLDDQRLQAGLERVYGLGYFSLVDYHLTQRPDGDYDLKVMARKADQGEQRVSTGFALSDNFNGDTGYQAGVKYVRQGLTAQGTELRLARRDSVKRMLASARIAPSAARSQCHVCCAACLVSGTGCQYFGWGATSGGITRG